MADGSVVLVHGGLYDGMDAKRFWVESGVELGLADAGLRVHLPDRPAAPSSWTQEADALAAYFRKAGLEKAAVVAGSNGCSAAVRLALDHAELVCRLILCWPATAGDEHGDRLARQGIEQRASSFVADRLLAGETLRGVADAEFRRLTVPVALVPAEPENAVHRRATVDRLTVLMPHAIVTEGSTESPHPDFRESGTKFIEVLTELLTTEYGT